MVFKMLLHLIAITMLANYKNWGFHSSEDIDWGVLSMTSCYLMGVTSISQTADASIFKVEGEDGDSKFLQSTDNQP